MPFFFKCCHNTEFAENSGFFQTVGLFDKLEAQDGKATFYDSAETTEHVWPSFRAAEAITANIKTDPSTGEVSSVCGTHLGHNLPDQKGTRYCIDLVCVAGQPRHVDSAAKVAARVISKLSRPLQ